MFNLNRLYYFYVIAKEGSLTQAVKSLNVSQPALSNQLKQLEDELNATLFDRSRKQLELTEFGSWLYHQSKDIFDIVGKIESRAHQQQKTNFDQFHFGVADGVERAFAVELLNRLTPEHFRNQVKIFLKSGAHEQLVSEIPTRGIDALISTQAVSNEYAQLKASCEMPVVFVVSNRLAKELSLELSTLWERLERHELSLILPASNLRLRKEIESQLASLETQPVVSFESNMMICLRRAVELDMGGAFLPYPYVAESVQNSELVSISPPEGFWKHRLYLYSKDDSSLEAQSLLQNFESALASMSAGLCSYLIYLNI